MVTRLHNRWLMALALAMPLATSAQEPEWEWEAPDLETVAATAAWANDNLPAPMRSQAQAWLQTTDWAGLAGQLDMQKARQLLAVLEQTLYSYSWDDLAELAPYGRMALDYLRSTPEGAPYAAWLEQRLDYLDTARIVVAVPGPRPTPLPRGTPVPPAARPTPAPQRRPAAADPEHWRKTVARHPLPARAATLIPRLKNVFRQEGMPLELVWLAEVESSLNPNARSPVGAAGLFQFMPRTAASFGLKLQPQDERLDPEKSAQAAARYLRRLYRQFKAWPLALAAYNAGEGRVGKLLARHNGRTFEDISPFLPLETRMYVPKIMATVQVREKIDPTRIAPPR